MVVEVTSGDAWLDEAERLVREEGYVILADVVDHGHLDALSERMTTDLETILAREVVPHQFVWGNVQQDPPPFPPYLFEDVIENRYVNALTRRVLGDGVFNRFYSGNTNLPGSKLQPVHVDDGDLWRGLTAPVPAHQLAVNVALDAVSEANGSIELWPGSHLAMSNVMGEDIKVSPERLDARRDRMPPARGNTGKGHVLVRDMRLWHRGTPNTTDAPRFMLALIHRAAFMSRGRLPVFRSDSASFFERIDAPLTAYTLSDPPIDYLLRHNPYDYPTAGRI